MDVVMIGVGIKKPSVTTGPKNSLGGRKFLTTVVIYISYI